MHGGAKDFEKQRSKNPKKEFFSFKKLLQKWR